MTDWQTPTTWNIGDAITAVEMNKLRDELLHLFEHKIQTGFIQAYPGHTPPTGWLFCDGSAVSTTTYAALFAMLVKTLPVVLTLASPGIVNWTAHGLPENAPVKFATTGALPTGLIAGTTYYVRPTISANGFSVAATPGGAAINFTGSQSGTHTAIHAPYGYTAGAGTFTLPDLRQKFPLGAKTDTSGYSLGSTGGALTQTLVEANLPAHTHAIGSHQHAIHHADASGASEGAARTLNASDTTTWNTDAAGGTSGSTGSGTAVSIMPPFQTVNYIIKI
jgi:microcystin-dependent protein